MRVASIVMNMVAIAVTLATLLSSASAAMYSVNDLGALPAYGGGSANDAGQVAGMLVNGHAFVYTPGMGAVDIGTLRGEALPLAINNAGQVAGHANVSGVEHAFLYTPGAGMLDLGLCVPALVSMNQAGQVTGQAAGTHVGSAFVYTPGSGTVYLSVPDGACYAHAISDSGQVVGQYCSVSTSNKTRAFSWPPGSGMIDLGTLGGDYSSAWAANNAGQVAGWSTLSDNVTVAAFLYTPGVGMVNIEVWGGASGIKGMNNSGQVVGATGAGADERGFVYTAGSGMALLDPLPGFASSAALHISDSGYVIGISFDANGAQHAVRWDFVPEPPSLLALATALGAFGAAVRRRRRVR